MKFDMRQNLTTLFGFIPNLFLKNLVKKLGSFQFGVLDTSEFLRKNKP